VVVPHASHVPTPLCDCSGAPAPRFGEAGDVCRSEGCGTRLSRYNPYDVCERCRERGREARIRKQVRRAAERSADEGPGFMEPAVLATREELEMAEAERRKIGATKERIRDYLGASGSWTGCAEVAARIGIATSTATSHLQDLWQAGHLERRANEGGSGFHYRARIEDVPSETAPASSQASAPVPEREHTAADEAAPSGTPYPLPEEPPAAEERGTWTSSSTGWVTLSAQPTASRELRVLCDLEELAAGERERVLAYAVSRWCTNESGRG